eukprot:Gb_07980 [translate_table: standard]
MNTDTKPCSLAEEGNFCSFHKLARASLILGNCYLWHQGFKDFKLLLTCKCMRTIAVLVTMTLGTSMAARQGPIPMAGHQICLQVWLAASMLTDSLALAGQVSMKISYVIILTF